MRNFHTKHNYCSNSRKPCWINVRPSLRACKQFSHNPSHLARACASHMCWFARMPEGHGARYSTVLIQVNWVFSHFQLKQIPVGPILNLLKDCPVKGGIVVLRLTVIRLHTLRNKPGIYCGPLQDFTGSCRQSGDVSLTVS